MTTFEATLCNRCGGSGKVPFAHKAGVCLACDGRGSVLTREGFRARQYALALPKSWPSVKRVLVALEFQRKLVLARDFGELVSPPYETASPPGGAAKEEAPKKARKRRKAEAVPAEATA
jgi:hypothetical protein